MYWITNIEGGPRWVNHAAATVGKYIYSFGGYCTGEDSEELRPMDVHMLNIDTYRWTKIPQTQHKDFSVPFQKYGHTAIAYDKNIYIWGGWNNKFICNILYYFDTTNHCWNVPEVKGMPPDARYGHSACLNGHQMYIFGGFKEDEESFSQEVYMLDLKELCWSYIATIGLPPNPREFHSSVVLRNRMYIFGGQGDRSDPNISNEELHSSHVIYLDFETGEWHRPYTSGDEPTGRRNHSAFVYEGNMYIFGGYNDNIGKHFNEIYQYNPHTSHWRKIKTFGTPPCARRRQSCVVVGDKMFSFGGTSPYLKPRRIPENGEDDETTDQIDHSDLHVLDFKPTLRTLSILEVIRNKLDFTCLPSSVQFDIEIMTTPNTITEPQETSVEKLLKIQ